MEGVVGQRGVGESLARGVRSGRLAHALLFTGDEGVGKLATALWLAQLLLCERGGDGPCGECGDCRRVEKLVHPDLHFSFPFLRRSTSTTADDYLQQWRELLGNGTYFGFDDWLRVMGDEGKNALITEAEADNVLHKLGLTSFEGGRKVLIIWLAERMNDAAANNLLKMVEEPPSGTYIIMIANDTRGILPTIMSRLQQVRFPRIEENEIEDALRKLNALEESTARDVAHVAQGSYLRALRMINTRSNGEEFFNRFVTLMRKAYGRDLSGLDEWCGDLSRWSREKLRLFWHYCQHMVRESFIYNFHIPALNFMGEKETQFVSRFAPFINERNVRAISNLLGQAEADVLGNVSQKILLFDMAMNMIRLIRR